MYADPSTPNAAEAQKALFHLELDVLKPSELPSNRISRSLYDELTLPWTVDPPVLSFSESGFTRFEWDRDGILTDGMDFLNGDDVTIDDLEKSLNTASMVTRWREANPELAGTEHDCVKVASVKVAIGEIRRAMGISHGGSIRTGNGVAILLFKRNEI
ncbi:hypothetical protein MAP00_007387 [Monascus purpureus]|nr:hypothetical protein MAP00_007387 [Monascus purpureus]